MIESIMSLVKDDNFAITLYKDKVHILNYINISDINDKAIELSLKSRLVKIKGSELKIVRLDKKEILIMGVIKGIDVNEK